MGKLSYEMRSPKVFFWMGIVCAALALSLLLAAFISAILVGEEGLGTDEISRTSDISAIIMLVFLLVVPPSGGYFALYSAKWKIKVEGDTLTIHMPFRPVRIIKFQDITEVKERFIGIAGYIDGKKVFAADMRTSYYELFVEQLKEAGKMGPSFTVRPYQGNLVLAVLLLLVFGGSLVGVIFWPNETVDLFVYLGISGAFLASLYFLANSLFWKITVTQDTLFVKNTFGVEKAYPIGEISKVEERRENFTLYAGTEKIVKIGKNAAGLQSLLERLVEENVSYYDNGQLF